MMDSSSAAEKKHSSKNAWTTEEDEKLKQLMQTMKGKCWSDIALHLPGRAGKQCRERWHNHLDPTVKKGAWTPEEDQIIFEQHKIHGNQWALISKMVPGRTDNAVKNRYYSTTRRVARQQARKSMNVRSNPMSSGSDGDSYKRRRTIGGTNASDVAMRAAAARRRPAAHSPPARSNPGGSGLPRVPIGTTVPVGTKRGHPDDGTNGAAGTTSAAGSGAGGGAVGTGMGVADPASHFITGRDFAGTPSTPAAGLPSPSAGSGAFGSGLHGYGDPHVADFMGMGSNAGHQLGMYGYHGFMGLDGSGTPSSKANAAAAATMAAAAAVGGYDPSMAAYSQMLMYPYYNQYLMGGGSGGMETPTSALLSSANAMGRGSSAQLQAPHASSSAASTTPMYGTSSALAQTHRQSYPSASMSGSIPASGSAPASASASASGSASGPGSGSGSASAPSAQSTPSAPLAAAGPTVSIPPPPAASSSGGHNNLGFPGFDNIPTPTNAALLGTPTNYALLMQQLQQAAGPSNGLSADYLAALASFPGDFGVPLTPSGPARPRTDAGVASGQGPTIVTTPSAFGMMSPPARMRHGGYGPQASTPPSSASAHPHGALGTPMTPTTPRMPPPGTNKADRASVATTATATSPGRSPTVGVGTGAGAGTGRPASVNPGGLGVDTSAPPMRFGTGVTPLAGSTPSGMPMLLPPIGMMGYDQKGLTPQYKQFLEQLQKQGGGGGGAQVHNQGLPALTPTFAGQLLTPTAAALGLAFGPNGFGSNAFALPTPSAAGLGLGPMDASSPSAQFTVPLGVTSPSDMLGEGLLDSPSV